MDNTNDQKNDMNQNNDSDNMTLDDMLSEAVDEKTTEETTAEPQTSEETVDTAEEKVETAEEAVTDAGETVETPTEELKEEASDEEKVETSETQPESEPNADEDSQIEEAPVEEKEEEKPTTATVNPNARGKWYIVHTYSGHENKVAKTLMQRVQSMGFEERIFDALVPTRETIRVRGGKKETVQEKIFPGYILVNMDLSDEAWVLVRTTPGVTSFVGAQNKPTPIRDDEVNAIVAFVEQKEPTYKAQFSNGEAVKITDGPFSDFLGTVESIDEAKGKVKVLVSIFGRETPVELDFLQVSKI